MRCYLLALSIIMATGCCAQTGYRFSAALQTAYNISVSPSVESALLLGVSSEEDADLMVGLAFRRLTKDPGHDRDYVSARIFGGRRLFGRLGAHIQAEFRRGTYYVYESMNGGDLQPHQSVKLFGNAGLHYRITNELMVMASYVIQDYNPQRFVSRRLSPHSTGALKIGIAVVMPSGAGTAE